MIPCPWTTDDDEVAFDAITVGTGDDSPALLSAGLTLAETAASVYWPDWITGGEKIHAALEGPYPVPKALERAEILCVLWGFRRIVISVQCRETWRQEWGELRDLEGLDA